METPDHTCNAAPAPGMTPRNPSRWLILRRHRRRRRWQRTRQAPRDPHPLRTALKFVLAFLLVAAFLVLAVVGLLHALEDLPADEDIAPLTVTPSRGY